MKILYVTTISNTVNAFLIPHIKMLIEEGHQVDIAFNVQESIRNEIYEMGCRIYYLKLSRTPLNIGNMKAYRELKKIIRDEEYNIIHTHTPVASAIVRMACKGIANSKIIYTAHGFHFYKGAPLKNWLIYYPIEKWLSRYTDILITINKEDYKIAKRFKSKKIEYVPGVGIDLDKFSMAEMDKELKCKDMNLPKEAFIILSIGELNKNKNHEVIIKAIAKINNPRIHYIVCGQGSREDYLKKIIKKLGIENQIHLLGFRKDIDEICKVSDVFVFPSFREGLSVALMEAMANSLPVICSNIRGNVDLIKQREGGYLIKPNDIYGFSETIVELMSDKELRGKFGENNFTQIQNYSIKNVITIMKKIYLS